MKMVRVIQISLIVTMNFEEGDDDLFLENVDRDAEDNNDLQHNFELENDQALDDSEGSGCIL
jgi:hypothetical protein